MRVHRPAPTRIAGRADALLPPETRRKAVNEGEDQVGATLTIGVTISSTGIAVSTVSAPSTLSG